MTKIIVNIDGIWYEIHGEEYMRPKGIYIPPDKSGCWIVYECGHVRELTEIQTENLRQFKDFSLYKDCEQCTDVTEEEFWDAARRSGTEPELGPETYYHQQLRKLLQMEPESVQRYLKEYHAQKQKKTP